MYDPFTKMLMTHFYNKPTETKGKLFTKSSIIPQDDGSYRASITFFIDGNSHSVMEIKPSLETAEDFVREKIQGRLGDNTPD